MIVIILAGGKSSRIGREKGIIEIGEKKLIDIVVEKAEESKAEDFFIAISPNAPLTKKYCDKRGYKGIETSGKGYHADLQYLLGIYPEFVSVACDIPFLRSEHINAIINFYEHNKKEKGENTSITGAVPRDIIPFFVIPPYVFGYEGMKLVACGLNVVYNAKESHPFLFNDPLLAININTPYDLKQVFRCFSNCFF